jgi:hypothetical protein
VAIEISLLKASEISSSSKMSLTIGCSAPRIEVIITFGGFEEFIWCKPFIRLVTVSLFGLNRSCGSVSQAGKLITQSPISERISSLSSSAIRVDDAITSRGEFVLKFAST